VTLTSLTKVTHLLHVRHALSRGAVPTLSATLVPPTPWWYGARLSAAGDLAVVAAERFPDGGPNPVVRLSIADPAAAASLTQPAVEVTLTQPEQTHSFSSRNLTVTVVLTDRQGRPKTGLNNVRAVPQAGGPFAMPEVAARPGTYRTTARAWTTAQLTLDIQAGNAVVGHYRLNPFALDTRLHGVVA
jgi:hypothetical protein